jgi:hypothetical protein
VPRDAVAVTTLTTNVVTNTPAGTTINTTNGANLAQYEAARSVVRITNTAGTEKEVTFKAGVNPPAVRKGMCDLIVKVPATTGDVLIPIEPSRFSQAEGTINVDFQSGMTGKISVVQISKDV